MKETRLLEELINNLILYPLLLVILQEISNLANKTILVLELL